MIQKKALDEKSETTNFEEMPLNEVVVDRHLVHPISSSDAVHFLAVIDNRSHPNPRR